MDHETTAVHLSNDGRRNRHWQLVLLSLLRNANYRMARALLTAFLATAVLGGSGGGPRSSSAPAAAAATISIDARAALARTDATRFASFSFDFTALFGVQRTAIPFADVRLRQYARNLAPAFVRFGGSLQDRAVSAFAGVPQPPPAPPTMLALALNESVFDGLVDFATATGLDLVYGLNAAVGRQTAAGGPGAPWDAENALAPVARAAARGYRFPVVELGNEVNVFNCSKDGAAKMSPAQLAAQYGVAAAAVRALLPGARIWGSDSSITGDVFGQCHDYYGDDIFGFNRDLFAQPGWAGLLDGYSWHYYSQDSRNATSTAALILSDEYQDRLLNADAKARALRDAAAPGLPILLGETASFWAGGRANVSNRFASGFFYLPQLASLAARGYLTHIRQDLAGGDYGMLDLVLDGAGVVVDFSCVPPAAPPPHTYTRTHTHAPLRVASWCGGVFTPPPPHPPPFPQTPTPQAQPRLLFSCTWVSSRCGHGALRQCHAAPGRAARARVGGVRRARGGRRGGRRHHRVRQR